MGRRRGWITGWLLLILAVAGVAGYLYWFTDRPVVTWGREAKRAVATQSAAGPPVSEPARSASPGNAPALPEPEPAPAYTTVSGFVENATGERVAGVAVKLIDERSLSDQGNDAATTGPDGAFAVMVPRGDSVYGLRVVREGDYLKDIESSGRIDLASTPDGVRAPSATRTRYPRYSSEKAAWERDHLTLPLRVPAGGLHDVVVMLTRATRISGRVVDEQRRPVKDVHVLCGSIDEQRIDGAGQPFVSFQKETAKPTDEQGRFVLGNLAPDHYALWGRYAPLRGDQEFDHCVMLGCAEYPLGEVALQEGEWLDNVEIQAPVGDGGSIEGSVVDQGGVGVEGARVFAIMAGHGAAGLTVTPTPKTGAFQIDRVLAEYPSVRPPRPIDRVTLRAECGGYEPLTMEDVEVGTRGIQLTMMRERRGTIAVRLRDAESGDTIRDATVKLWRTETTWGESRADRAVLGGDPTKNVKPDWLGWFVLESVPAGVSEIVIKARGYGIKQHGGVVVHEGKTAKVDLLLEGAGLICARAVGDETVNGWKASPSKPSIAPVVDSSADSGTDAQRLQLKSNDCPASDLNCDVSPEREPPFTHQNFAVPPGRYLVQFHVTLSDSSVHATTIEELRLADMTRYIPATVRSGGVARVEFSMARGEASSVEVVPPPDCRVIELFPGDTLPPISNHRREPIPPPDTTTEYHRVSAISPPFLFPCVAPGSYVVACSLEGKWADPVTKNITVVAGQTVKVVFE